MRLRPPRKQVRFLLVALLVLATNGGTTRHVVGAESVARESPDTLRAEYRNLIALLPRGARFQTWSDPESTKTLQQLWRLFDDWVAAYLNLYPQSNADDLAGAIATLSPDLLPEATGFEGYQLGASALQLATGLHAAYAVAVNFGRRGTVMVVARRDGGFRTVWDIREVAEKHRGSGDNLDYWATEARAYPDGCLTGVVHPLIGSAGGHPRFLIDATPHPEAGSTHSKQIGIWEWDGQQPRVLLMNAYTVSLGTTPPLSINGSTIEIHTKGPMRVLSTCAADPRPDVQWRIRVGPNGVRDLGKQFVEPEWDVVDDLFWRLLSGQSTHAIASPAASDSLLHYLDVEQYKSSQTGIVNLAVLEHRGKVSKLFLIVDGPLNSAADLNGEPYCCFTIDRRKTKAFVTRVKCGPSAERFTPIAAGR